MTYTLGEIAAKIKAELHGDPDCKINGIAPLDTAASGKISFLSNRRYASQLKNTAASAVILKQDDMDACPVHSLVCEDPYVAYAHVARLLNPPRSAVPGLHPSSIIADNADIDDSVEIGPHVTVESGVRISANSIIDAGCFIGKDTVIGRNTRLYPNVVICAGVTIGRDCILHPGVVIGADGFGIANEEGKWLKIPQIGGVTIGNEVEIGANTSIDRGALGNTVIADGVKIDNQVQIGHNVRIGEDTAIAGCVGIAGSTRVGKRCMIGGAVGISGHIDIADDVVIMAMAGIANSIKESGVYASAIPAMDVRKWRRNVVGFKQLHALISRIKKLENQ